MTDPLLCPRCPGHGLFTGEARGVHLHACGGCGGVWLAPEVARRVLRPLFTPGGLPGTTSPGACPACRAPMVAWTVGETGVELDSCDRHGTWFDRQELESLARAASSLRGRPEPDFTPLQAREFAPAAVAGAAAAIAATAVSHADLVLAVEQQPAQEGHVGAVLEVASLAPDLAYVGVEATTAGVHVVGEAVSAIDVGAGAEAVGAGVEAAGSLLGALLEFVGGIFS